MTLQEQLRTTRDALGRATQEARRLGNEIRERQAKGEAVSELEEAFSRAHADMVRLTREVELLQRQIEVERTHEALTAPETTDVRPRAQGGADTSAQAKRRQAHAQAFADYLRHGDLAAQHVLLNAGFGPQEVFALLGSQADLGGFLVPDDFRAEVVKDLAQMAVMRGICRVVPTSRDVLVYPSIQSATGAAASIYSSGYTGAWKPQGYVTGGTAPPVQNQPKFGQERIPVHSWQPDAVELSQELLQDSAAPVDDIVSEVIAETLALDEDSAFIGGDGVGKPLGLTHTSAGIATVNSGSASALTYDGLVDLFTGLPSQYRQNSRWLMNAGTLGAILKLKDSQSRPLFTVNELPGTLWTRPMVFSEFMPDIAANATPIAFGDFRYYVIAERRELRVQRLVERYAPNIGLLPTAREGGQPIRKDAFRLQKIAA